MMNDTFISNESFEQSEESKESYQSKQGYYDSFMHSKFVTNLKEA